MNTYLRFDGSLAFQRFLGDHATRIAGWRGVRAWKPPGQEGFLVEWPSTEPLPTTLGGFTESAPPSPSSGSSFLLGETWRRARPVRREERGHMAPSCFLILVREGLDGAARLIIEQAPAGLEFISLSIGDGGVAKEACGFLLRGEAGRMVAHAPPFGCVGYECDELREELLLAFPVGWTVPPLLEELWPEMGGSVHLYAADSTTHSITTGVLRRRLPLADLVSCTAKPQEVLINAHASMKRTPWRVIRRESPRTDHEGEAEERGVVSVVYRLRTFDRAFSAAGDISSSRGHELGQSFLQILDECEAGLLPEVLYAGFDAQRYERWHLLYIKEATERLLDSWNMVERFDHLEELETHGIHAYLSRRSSMLPPVRALLGSGSDHRAIGERIRALLGNPGKDTIVLIEDLEEDPRSPSTIEDGPPSNPRIIHIDRCRAVPLRKVLPDLVRDWHNAEPISALGASSEHEALGPLREQLERKLLAIGEDEDSELRAAADSARSALSSWATAVANALDAASKPVADAQELCVALGITLGNAASSINDASEALGRYCDRLTTPRRDWMARESERTTAALQETAPRIDEARSAQREAERSAGLLEERTRTLQAAADAVRSFEPRLDALQLEGETALAQATQTRSEVEARARATAARIAQRRQDVQEQLQAAQQVQASLNAERERLRQEESAVIQLERANAALRQANDAKTAELAARRQRTSDETRELTRYRDQEIPSLTRQTEEAERQLAALNPNGIRSRLRDAQTTLDEANSQIQKANQEIVRIQGITTEVEQARSRLITQREAVEKAAAERSARQAEADAAERDLSRQRDELESAQKAGGAVENCEKRLKYAKKALAEIESMKKPKGFLGGFFG